MYKVAYLTVLSFLLSLIIACDSPESVIPMADSDASVQTVQHNEGVKASLALDEQQDFIQARRGLIAEAPLEPVTNEAGKTIWDPANYSFIAGEAPATVNPSLWRQASLNNIRGLFKVSEGI